MESVLGDCEVKVDDDSQLIVVTWGTSLSYEGVCGFLLSYNLHKSYPSYGLLFDFRQVETVMVLINDLMRLAEVATKLFDEHGVTRTAFWVITSEQKERAAQYIQLRQTLSKLELCQRIFFDGSDAVRWLIASR